MRLVDRLAGLEGGLARAEGAVDRTLELGPERVLLAAAQRQRTGLLLPMPLQFARAVAQVAHQVARGHLVGQCTRVRDEALALLARAAAGILQGRLQALHGGVHARDDRVACLVRHGVLHRPELAPGGREVVERAGHPARAGRGAAACDGRGTRAVRAIPVVCAVPAVPAVLSVRTALAVRTAPAVRTVCIVRAARIVRAVIPVTAPRR